jgi:CRP-like cAMP-binding protein
MEQQPLELFPFLANTPYTEMTLSKGAWMFREHEGCGRIGFVIGGSVKIFKEHSSGRSITLYRLGPGDSCILSMSCAMANPIHQASAVVEEDCRVLTVTTDQFRSLMERSSEARDYVFGLFASRLTDVLLLLEEVVFRRMDERLASILLEHAVRRGNPCSARIRVERSCHRRPRCGNDQRPKGPGKDRTLICAWSHTLTVTTSPNHGMKSKYVRTSTRSQLTTTTQRAHHVFQADL